MTYKEKRELLQFFLQGKDGDGMRNGVYVYKRDGKWHFVIRGIIGKPIQDCLPLEEWRANDMLDIEEAEELCEVQDVAGQCHAHYRLGLHQR
jgi:hypothetical protein